jgi:hypothetical protein
MFFILSTAVTAWLPVYKTAWHKPVSENTLLGDLCIMYKRRSRQGGSDMGFIRDATEHVFARYACSLVQLMNITIFRHNQFRCFVHLKSGVYT